MLFRTLSALCLFTLESRTGSWSEMPGTATSTTISLGSVCSGLVKGFAALVFIALTLALLLTGWLPAVFVGIALFLPALLPALVVLGAVFATAGNAATKTNCETGAAPVASLDKVA
jgi:hypothetical protein